MKEQNPLFSRSFLVLLIWFGSAFAFFACVTAPVLQQYADFTFRNYDLGIYAQAAHAIRFSDLNPYLSTRLLHVFSDHFDPAVILLAPWAKLWDPGLVLIWADSVFVGITGGLLTWLGWRNRLHPLWLMAILLLLFFNLGTLQAVANPAHPSTWTVLPIFLLGWALWSGRFYAIMSALVFLSLFKEEYVFCWCTVALWALFSRRWRLFGACLLGFLVLVTWDFYFRFKLFPGPFMDYGGGLLAPLKENGFKNLKNLILQKYIGENGFHSILRLVLPFLIFYLFIFRWWRLPIGLLLALLPILAIRFLANKWGDHYGISVGAFGVALLFFGMVAPANLKSYLRTKSRSQLGGMAGLGLLTVLGCLFWMDAKFWRDFSNLQALNSVSRDPDIQNIRRKSIHQGIAFLLNHPKGNVIAEEHLVPNLAARSGVWQLWRPVGWDGQSHLYQLEGGQRSSLYRYASPHPGLLLPARAENADYFFLENPDSGGSYAAMNAEEIRALIRCFRSDPAVLKIMDDGYAFLVRMPEP